MAKVKTQSQVKKKKKIWVQLNSPKLFGEKKIGETHVMFPENAVGKTVEQNLMNLTGDMKKQNITIKFKVEKVTGTVGHTKVISYKMAPSFIKRMVRRRRDRLDLSKVYTTKDGIKVRIKPIIVTTSHAKGSILTLLRKKAHALLSVKVKQLKFDALMEEIISYRVQSYIKSNLKSIHPVKNCEIRVFEIEKLKKKKGDVEVIDESENDEDESSEEQEEQEKEKEEKETTEKTDEEESKEDKKDEEKPVEEKEKTKEDTEKIAEDKPEEEKKKITKEKD